MSTTQSREELIYDYAPQIVVAAGGDYRGNNGWTRTFDALRDFADAIERAVLDAGVVKCPKCDGSGQVLFVERVEDFSEEAVCLCHGTGRTTVAVLIARAKADGLREAIHAPLSMKSVPDASYDLMVWCQARANEYENEARRLAGEKP